MLKIKNREALFAAVNFISVKVFTAAIQSMVNISGSSAWIFFIINTCFTVICFLLFYFLYKKSGEKDIFLCLPPFFRKIFSVFVTLYFIISSGLILNLLIKGIIRTFMPESPSLFIAAFFIIPVIYAAKKGVKANTSLSVLLSPVLLFALVVAIVLLPYYDFTNIFPVMGNNDFYLKAIYGFNFFSDLIIFIILMPHLEQKEKALKTGLWIILLSSLLCLLVLLSDILAIPKEAHFFSPFYYMVSFLSGSRSAINFVRILKLCFLVNFFLYFSTAVSFAAYSLERGFNLKYGEKLVPLLSALLLLAEETSYKEISILDLYNCFMKYSFIIFPLLPIVIYLFKRKERSGK